MKKRLAKKRKEIKVKFEAQGITGKGGLLFIEELINKLRVREFLDQGIMIKKRERGFDESDHILSMVYNLIAEAVV